MTLFEFITLHREEVLSRARQCCRSIWLMELRPGWMVSTAAVSGARARA